METQISEASRETFYRGALMGLRYLDRSERLARRFGADADARWEGFRGHLGVGDRLDILIRDAAGKWHAAFSPAEVFALPGLAADEPFGPDWRGLPEDRAEALWSGDLPEPNLAACAEALGIVSTPVEVPPLLPSTHLVVAGGAAILAVGEAFAARPELSWSDQLLVVAEAPTVRHFAGLAAPLLGAQAATRLVFPAEEVAATLDAVDFSVGGHAVISPDASPAARHFARQAALEG